MLRRYLEVLTATHDTPLSAQLRERIADHAGLHLAAFATADAAAEHRRLAEAGFASPTARRYAPSGRRRFRALHDRPRRARDDAKVARAVPDPPYRAAGGLDDMLDHPNGAEALTALWIAAEDPAEPATRYTRFAGRPARRQGKITTGRARPRRAEFRDAGLSRRGDGASSRPAACHAWWRRADRGREPRQARSLPRRGGSFPIAERVRHRGDLAGGAGRTR